MKISNQPFLVKVMTHNSTNQIVNNCSENINKSLIGRYLISIKNEGLELKTHQLISSIINKISERGERKVSAMTSKIKNIEKGNKKTECEIIKLTNENIKISNKLSSQSIIKNRNVLSMRLRDNTESLVLLKNIKDANEKTANNINDKIKAIRKETKEFKEFNFIASYESVVEFSKKLHNSGETIFGGGSSSEKKLNVMLKKREKYEGAINQIRESTKKDVGTEAKHQSVNKTRAPLPPPFPPVSNATDGNIEAKSGRAELLESIHKSVNETGAPLPPPFPPVSNVAGGNIEAKSGRAKLLESIRTFSRENLSKAKDDKKHDDIKGNPLAQILNRRVAVDPDSNNDSSSDFSPSDWQ